MYTSQNGVNLIKEFEGLELEAYRDIAGIWTIGYGHTGDVYPGQSLTEDEAESLLRQDLIPRERAVGSLVKVSLNQNEFDALVSFVYNLGKDALARSTFLKNLNAGYPRMAAQEMLRWNKARVKGVLKEVPGLTRRRAAERKLFLTPVKK